MFFKGLLERRSLLKKRDSGFIDARALFFVAPVGPRCFAGFTNRLPTGEGKPAYTGSIRDSQLIQYFKDARMRISRIALDAYAAKEILSQLRPTDECRRHINAG